MSQERCGFKTTIPESALKQAAQAGNPMRYKRCRNRATTTVVVKRITLTSEYEREVPACSLHKRLHDERGWMP